MDCNNHKGQLFLRDGKHPIKFSMRPCDERVKLKPVIEQGGGVITSKSSIDSIRLAEPNSKVFGDNCISSKYIWDCFKANSLLSIENYRIKQQVSSDISDISDTENDFKTFNYKPTGKNSRGRREYMLDDDKKIIEYICSTRRFTEIRGRRMWQSMETLEVLPNRTWQSMKERFIKQILPNLESYRIPSPDLKNLKLHAGVSDNVFKRKEIEAKKSSSAFTPEIDTAILNCVLKRKDFKMITDKELWKNVELDIVNEVQSWVDLRDRFLRHIVPNITTYNVDEKYKNALKKLMATLSPVNGKTYPQVTNSSKHPRKGPLPVTTSKYFRHKQDELKEDNSANLRCNEVRPNGTETVNVIDENNTNRNSAAAFVRHEGAISNTNKSDDEETLQLELSEDSNSRTQSERELEKLKNCPGLWKEKQIDVLCGASDPQVIVLEKVCASGNKPTMRLSMCALPKTDVNNLITRSNGETTHITPVQKDQTRNSGLPNDIAHSRNASCETQFTKVVSSLKVAVLRENENLVQPPDNSSTTEPDLMDETEKEADIPKKLQSPSSNLKRMHSSLHRNTRNCNDLENGQSSNPRTKVLHRKKFCLHYGLENNTDSQSSGDDSNRTQSYVEDDDDNVIVSEIVKKFSNLPENPDDCSERDDQNIIEILRLILRCSNDEVREICRRTNCNLSLILRKGCVESKYS